MTKTLKDQAKLLAEVGILSVASVTEAVALSKYLKEVGRFDLFRGQTNIAWPVTPTAHRCSRDQYLEGGIRFEQFKAWASQQPELSSYSSDSLWAIAQHYGFTTQFIDFTFCPEVAGFFACDTPNGKPGQRGAIYCINSMAFEGYWKDKPLRLSSDSYPEVLKIDVSNLWRLKAQCGCFVWNAIVHQKGLAGIYPAIARIEFPWVRDDDCLPKKDQIYPTQPSPLEQRLDQFFFNEVLTQRNEDFSRVSQLIEVSPFDPPSGWNQVGIPVAVDWFAAHAHWSQRPAAEYQRASDEVITVLDSQSKAEMLNAARECFSLSFIRTRRNGQILIRRASNRSLTYQDCGSWEDEFSVRLALIMTRLWEGMRFYPFTDQEIHASIHKTLGLLDERYLNGIQLPNHELTTKVEFSFNRTGRGAEGSAFVSPASLASALNPAFRSAVDALGPRLPIPFSLFPELWLPCSPRQRFRFCGLRELMVSEIIPSQMVLRGDRDGKSWEKLPLAFSPFDLFIFGPS